MQSEVFEMDSLANLEKRAIKLLQAYQPKDRPYWGCFSGGKDSVVIKALAEMAGVSVVWHYNVTTIDPPELVMFIRKQHPDVKFEKAPESFWHALERNRILPTRRMRWCCKLFKERKTPPGNTLILGVRSQESDRRAAQWQFTRTDSSNGNLQIAPILAWKTHNVWDFIRTKNLPYCSLYDEGFERLGCVGCPMAGRNGMLKEFARWPRYEMLVRRSLAKVFDANKQDHFTSPDDWFDWWVNGREKLPLKEGCNQFFDQFDQA